MSVQEFLNKRMSEIDYSQLPEHMRDGMRLHVEEGGTTGHFLTAVLENDLAEASLRADDVNRTNLHRYVSFLYWQAPQSCWGSPEKVKAWQELGGLKGLIASGE